MAAVCVDEVVLVAGLLHVEHVVKEARQRRFPVRLEEGQSSWREQRAVAGEKVRRAKGAQAEVQATRRTLFVAQIDLAILKGDGMRHLDDRGFQMVQLS